MARPYLVLYMEWSFEDMAVSHQFPEGHQAKNHPFQKVWF